MARRGNPLIKMPIADMSTGLAGGMVMGRAAGKEAVRGQIKGARERFRKEGVKDDPTDFALAEEFARNESRINKQLRERAKRRK